MKRAVIVVPYDPAWPQAFAIASREVAGAMGQTLMEIHHIGSTSIPQICAKPIIDMLAVVESYEAVGRSLLALTDVGWVTAPEPHDVQEFSERTPRSNADSLRSTTRTGLPTGQVRALSSPRC